MPDDAQQISDMQDNLPPPSGDSSKAEKYISQLVEFINQDKLKVNQTDLTKFDPSALQNHYFLDLKDYQIEVSHSKHPDTGNDFFVILFNNIKNVRENCSEKVILAYMHLDRSQFETFKSSVQNQILRERKAEEEKRLHEAMAPIDQALESLSSQTPQEIQNTNVLAKDGLDFNAAKQINSSDTTLPPL